MDTPVDNLTLEALRPLLGQAMAGHAAFDGWGEAALEAAARDIGLDPAVARFAFGGNRVAMIDAWFAAIDAAMLARLTPETLAALKIRARVTALVEARLDLLAPDREALRRAVAILALPVNLPDAARLGWRAADVMWRAAGDTATDYNHYSKRTILAGVYGATLSVFLDDDSDGQTETRAFLARRIDGIMRFEKAKAKWTAPSDRRFSLSRFASKLRYPAR